MKVLLLPFIVLGRAVWRLVTLIRDGEADLDATYPDRPRATGPEAAGQGSMAASMMGVGHP